MISKSLPLFFDRTLLEQTGIEEYITWDFIRFPHFLLIGATGTGKTTAAKLIVARAASIPDAQITLCDFKADDFKFLAGCKRYYEFFDCQRGLENFFSLLQARQQGTDTSRSFQLLLFDEFASFLSMLDRHESEIAKMRLSSLLSLGRGFNLHTMVVQQRGDSQFFGTARDNFNIIVELGNIFKESAAMFGFDRDQMRPVHKLGAGYMLMDSTDLRAIQVPRVRNIDKLHAAIKRTVN